MGLGDFLKAGLAAADRVLTIKNLLSMSESAGLKQLDTLAPRTHREDWSKEFLQGLSNASMMTSETDEYRQKARTFYAYSVELLRNL